MYIRQTKNDSIDSFLIAEVIRFGQFGTTSMADENILAMRQLCRYRDSVISSRTEIKLRIGTIMEQIFPEYEKQFSSLWVSTSMGLSLIHIFYIKAKLGCKSHRTKHPECILTEPVVCTAHTSDHMCF